MDLRQRNTTDKIAHAIDEVKAAEHDAVEFVKTLTWTQLEEWQRDNEYITSGYRRCVEICSV